MTPMAELVLKVSLVLTASLVTCFALRSRSAALRHWVLSVGIVCAATTPVVVWVGPVWHVPMIVRGGPRAQPEVARGVAAEPAGRAELSVGRPLVPAAGNEDRPRIGLARTIGVIWLGGTLIGLTATTVGLARLLWIRSRARLLKSGIWVRLAREIASAMGIRRRVALLESDLPSLLFTWGSVRPKIVLPRDASQWSVERARIVLGHELAHVRRGDWAILMAAEVLRAIYWFNPLTWIVSRRLREESERACDDAVMSLGVDGAEYAAELLALARILNADRIGWMAAPAMARPSSLETRVTAMVAPHVNRQPVGRAPRVLIMALSLALAVAVGGFTAAAQTFVSFAGSVVDPTGNVVTGVTLTMTNKQTGQKYQVMSSDVGAFEFVGLTPGEYDLEPFTPGFRASKNPITIGNRNVRSDIHLEVGSLEETITVIDRGEPRADDARPRVRGGSAPETPACVAKPTGGYIAQPTKIADARPIYPRSGGVPKAGNVVVLDARIGTEGTVVDARGVDPTVDPDLVAAAVEAVKLWKYTPTLLNCIPIEVQMKVTVNFRTEK